MNKLLLIILALLWAEGVHAQQEKIYPVHISLVQPLGLHGAESRLRTYRFSLNLLGGTVGSVKGLELGTLYNQNTMDMSGLQMSGVLNVTKGRASGVQLSTVANSAGPVVGVQASSVANIADDVKGVQLSGIVNRAKMLRGFQIGLINIADSVVKGGAIGLVSIVKKGGYRELELSTADYQTAGVSFRSGTKSLYTILSLGYLAASKHYLVTGVGLGRLVAMGPGWVFRPEVMGYTYVANPFKDKPTTNSVHLKLGFVRKLSNSLAINLVPSLYAAFQPQRGDTYEQDINLINPFFSSTNGRRRVDYGVGLSAGLSFIRH